jgi:xanthine dehydrogenase accessory factor
MKELYQEALRLLDRDEPFSLATVIRTQGSTPRKPGSMMLIRENGDIVGSLGGGCVEGDVWAAATGMLKRKEPAALVRYHLNEPVTSPHGMICGGSMEFLVEPILSSGEFLPIARAILNAIEGGDPVSVATRISEIGIGKKLAWLGDGSRSGTLGDPVLDEEAMGRMSGTERFVTPLLETDYFIKTHVAHPMILFLGGGHIAKATESFAKPLGFRFTVVDDRPLFANRDRFLEAENVLVRDFESALDDIPLTAESSIVVATRGHQYDDVALEAAIRTPAKYVGLVSSRRKWLLLRRKLLERGLPENRVGEIHAPIGLDLGSRSPEEIALSILGEIVAFRNGREGKPLKYDPGLGT